MTDDVARVTSKDLTFIFLLVAFAGLIAAISLVGWLLALPVLTGFGMPRFPIWPWASIGYVALAAGFWATVKGYRFAPGLLAAPLLIGAIVAVEALTGVSLGFDRLLFAGQIARLPAGYPGRPGPNAVATFLFLGTALLQSRSARGIVGEFANVLATAALCFGVFAALFMIGSSPATSVDDIQYVASLPGALATVALTTAFLFWRRGSGWIALLGEASQRGRYVGMMIPLIALLPIAPLLVSRWVVSPAHHPLIGADLLAVLINVAVIGVLLLFAVTQITRQQRSLTDLASALDLAAITLTGPDGEIVYWSRGCEQLYGWSRAEAVGRSKYDLLQSGDYQVDGQSPLMPAAGERQLRERRKDGTTITVLEKAQPLERPGEQSVFVVKMVDISALVTAVEALRNSETRLANAAAAYQLGISEWDAATGEIHWSPGSEQRIGIKPGYLSTFHDWEALVDPADLAEVSQTLERAVANRDEHLSFRYRLRLPDGTFRIIEGSGHCLYDDAGRLSGMISANIDVTERSEREAAQQLESIMATVPDATIIIDSAGLIRSFSAAAERMFGHRASDVIGRNVKLLMPRSIADSHDASIARYLCGMLSVPRVNSPPVGPMARLSRSS